MRNAELRAPQCLRKTDVAFLVPARPLILACVVWLVGATAIHAQAVSATEYELKAAMIHQFLSFVEWPEDVLAPDTHDSITVCVLGDDPFGSILDDLAEKQTVGGRPVSIRRGAELQVLGFCHAVFISSSERRRVAELLDALSNVTVLTVGDMDGFANDGGMIGLTSEDNKIHFAVNIDAVAASNLTVSSRLLRLATIVRRGSAGAR